MYATFTSFCRRLRTGLIAFMGFGLCLSGLSVMEQRLGLVGKANHLSHVRPPISIPLIGQNLSGVTWSRATGTLFAVTNSPQVIHELSPTGKVLRSIALEGFSDTEDITHIEGDTFALIEERRGLIRRVRITDETVSIRAEESPSIDLGSRHEDNKGFESLFFDPATRTLLTMRELPPYELVSVPLDTAGEPGTILREPLELSVDDVAALGRDAAGDLWILSEASSCLIRLDANGRELHRANIVSRTLPCEPEGLAFGENGDIFVVGEPCTFMVSRTHARSIPVSSHNRKALRPPLKNIKTVRSQPQGTTP